MSYKNNSFSKWFYILRAAKPLLLSHHPNCDRFQNHVINIKGHRICFGCLIIYPTLILSLITIFILKNQINYLFEWYIIFIGALLVSLKIIDFDTKSYKLIVNIFTGIGVALAIFSIFGLPFDLWINVIIFILFILFTGFIAGYKFDKKMKVCTNECEYKRDWSQCPGLKDVYAKIYVIENEHE